MRFNCTRSFGYNLKKVQDEAYYNLKTQPTNVIDQCMIRLILYESITFLRLEEKKRKKY